MTTFNRDYEAILLLQPELDEAGLSKIQAQFSEILSRHSGRIVETVSLGRRKMTFKVGKRSEANYLQLKIQMPPQQVAAFQKAASLVESLLRLMIVDDRTLPAGGAAPATKRSDEDEVFDGESQ